MRGSPPRRPKLRAMVDLVSHSTSQDPAEIQVRPGQQHGTHQKGGYIVEWFIGDHEPRHVHVFDANGRFLGRLNIETLAALEDWSPSDKLVALIEDLKAEGKL